jgi:hypothetical protein
LRGYVLNLATDQALYYRVSNFHHGPVAADHIVTQMVSTAADTQ